MKFDENLRAFRKQKEFSQEYLAEKMNVSRQTISKCENGMECKLKCAYTYDEIDSDGLSTAFSVEVDPDVTITFPNGTKCKS